MTQPQKKKTPLANQNGAYFLMSAIVLGTMVGFTALGVEIGRWYGIQAEMSKAIDAGAFAGAKNVSNPKFPTDAALEAFALEVAQANFPPGLLDTVTPVFTADLDANGKVTVNGNTHSLNHMTTVFDTGTAKTALGAVGSAKLRKAEIVMVLDVSGSMKHDDAIADLRDGAEHFVKSFEELERDHKMALITFAAGVQVLHPLEHHFSIDMTNEITDLKADGWTNTEDAIDQAGNFPWADNTGLPKNEATRQIVILFSDGNPTAFRGSFTREDQDYDAVVPRGGSNLFRTDVQSSLLNQGGSNVPFVPTGDGRQKAQSICGTSTTKWAIFEDSTYGVNGSLPTSLSGRNPEECNLPADLLTAYVDKVSREMALEHAQELKDQELEIFTIGLGEVDKGFLETISSGAGHAFFANDPDELTGIFHEIANKIKLVLIS
jgi:Mg-chelatase subunit ChlD